MTKRKYIVATVKSWNIEYYNNRSSDLSGNWSLITKKEDLTLEALSEFNPEYVFFPHWSWKVNKQITDKYSCVCFHMTDLPYGRGGSPLQNLILNGHKDTVITAIQMCNELDAGPVYLKRPLSLEGSAEQIFRRASDIVFKMIEEIVNTDPVPIEQLGNATYFQRRTPAQSIVPENISICEFYDYVRMLDAEDYPNAFIKNSGFIFEFSDANIESDKVTATVIIRKAK